MPRRKRYKALIIKSFYCPIESKEMIEKGEELAGTEKISFSEIIMKALAEYLHLHYPGNPQIQLNPTDEKIDTYMNDLAARKLAAFLKWIEKYPSSPVKDSERLKVLGFTRRLRNPSQRVEELVDKVLEA
jgi:hypothetical protein